MRHGMKDNLYGMLKIARIGDSRGMALLMTLWIGVLLAVVGAGFALSMRTGLASTRNFKKKTLSRLSSAYQPRTSACSQARANTH